MRATVKTCHYVDWFNNIFLGHYFCALYHNSETTLIRLSLVFIITDNRDNFIQEILHTYKFLKHVNFKDVTNSASHDLIFKYHQLLCSPIDASLSFANEILKMKISQMAS